MAASGAKRTCGSDLNAIRPRQTFRTFAKRHCRSKKESMSRSLNKSGRSIGENARHRPVHSKHCLAGGYRKQPADAEK
jgi:hypothetical protein